MINYDERNTSNAHRFFFVVDFRVASQSIVIMHRQTVFLLSTHILYGLFNEYVFYINSGRRLKKQKKIS